MAIDTSARPHELLNLRIKDIKFKISSEGIQYAEVTVNGKTGNRTLPLIDSIPYLKEWLLAHPYGDRQDAWLFISLSDKNLFSNKNEKTGLDLLLFHESDSRVTLFLIRCFINRFVSLLFSFRPLSTSYSYSEIKQKEE